MEITDTNLVTLAEYLQKTLSPDVSLRKPAEKFLESVETNQNYPLLILTLVQRADVDITIRIAGAVAFKNYVKRNWPLVEGEPDRIHASDRDAIKGQILHLMLTSPEAIQKQLSDATSIIGKYDFPDKWPNLITDMVGKFNTGDFHVINGVLHTAHSLFRRYRHEFKSQKLWTEIKFVLENFASPFTELFKATINLVDQHKSNPAALKVIYNSLVVSCKIFYSLNFQDLPEYFEDNMPVWMPAFHNLLVTDVPCLRTDDEEEEGVLDQLRTQICDCVCLYARMYSEEFGPYIRDFVTDVWNILTSTSTQQKYDNLVGKALQFLAIVADCAQYRSSLFESPEVLTSLCEKVIIPNLELRPCDVELFEDSAEEYIWRDMEGSDVETRRRAACDFVKILVKYMEDKMMATFGSYVEEMLKKYYANPSQIKYKDTAIYLVTSLASQGSTVKHGTTKSSTLVNLEDFAQQHIFPELTKPDVASTPLLRADSLKFLVTFRSVLPPPTLLSSLPLLVRHLESSHQVVHSYAAHAIDRVLIMKAQQQDGSSLVTAEVLSPLAAELYKNLLLVFTRPGSEENEYAMKCIMRSMSTLQDKVIPYLSDLLFQLTQRLGAAAKNPSKPNYNHFLFESITLAIRIVCKQTPEAVETFEQTLFPIFQIIIQQDILEFLPYTFQILSLLLEFRPRGSISPPYVELYPFLLSPVLWSRPGNIHPLGRLLRAYLMKSNPQDFGPTLKLNNVLGVFQKLIASKTNDHEGFLLMQTLLELCPNELLAPHMKQIFVLLFQRLSSSRTVKYSKGLITFLMFYVINLGASNLVGLIDSIQGSLFSMVAEKLLLSDLQKVNGHVNRKIAAFGLAKLLTEAPDLINGPYTQFWARLTCALLNLIQLPEDETPQTEDQTPDLDDKQQEYDAAYSKLTFASDKEDYDPLSGIGDTKAYIVEAFKTISNSHPNLISNMPEGDRQKLFQFCS
uniref:Exportin-2 n=1 Tax=Cacopsylla melanoneura TaxID=428564 RepID=A0A8D8S4P8_9HEMI